jgi:hypothetical protein
MKSGSVEGGVEKCELEGLKKNPINDKYMTTYYKINFVLHQAPLNLAD